MMADRYATGLGVEGQFQPGSNGTVLLNKLGIIRSDEMNDIELELLIQLTEDVIDDVTDEQSITVADLSAWHLRWLGHVYEWAGRYRSVNMGKAEFHFAAAHLVPKLMQALENEFLSLKFYTRHSRTQTVDFLFNNRNGFPGFYCCRTGNAARHQLLCFDRIC